MEPGHKVTELKEIVFANYFIESKVVLITSMWFHLPYFSCENQIKKPLKKVKYRGRQYPIIYINYREKTKYNIGIQNYKNIFTRHVSVFLVLFLPNYMMFHPSNLQHATFKNKEILRYSRIFRRYWIFRRYGKNNKDAHPHKDIWCGFQNLLAAARRLKGVLRQYQYKFFLFIGKTR